MTKTLRGGRRWPAIQDGYARKIRIAPLSDDELGIFLVVDGLGGHAAGEKAAETAVDAIREEMAKAGGDPQRPNSASDHGSQ